MDANDAINDSFRQTAHAEEIRQRRAGQQDTRSPEQKEISDLSRRLAALENWRSNLKGRGGIKVEDGEIVFQGGQPQTQVQEGEWYPLTLCDSTTLEVRAKNIVPPEE